MVLAHEYYSATLDPDASPAPACPGYSIPAAEHSTITSWGKDQYKNMNNKNNNKT